MLVVYFGSRNIRVSRVHTKMFGIYCEDQTIIYDQGTGSHWHCLHSEWEEEGSKRARNGQLGESDRL